MVMTYETDYLGCFIHLLILLGLLLEGFYDNVGVIICTCKIRCDIMEDVQKS